MIQVVVGNEPCSYKAVCDAIDESRSVAVFWSKFWNVARRLGISHQETLLMKTSLYFRMTTYNDLLHDVLEMWRGKQSTNAKLHTFINILEMEDLNDCADTLKQKFSNSLDLQDTSTSEASEIDTSGTESSGNQISTPSKLNDLIEENDKNIKVQISSAFSWPIKKSETLPKKRKANWDTLCIYVIIAATMFVIGIVVGATCIHNYSIQCTEKAQIIREVRVNSSIDYEYKMRAISSKDKIYLHINIKKPEDWNYNVKLHRAESISEISLEGPFSLQAIYGILDHTAKNLRGLTMKDNGSSGQLRLCDYEESLVQVHRRVLTLQSVEKLHLDIALCDRIVNLLVSHTYFPSVVEFYFIFDDHYVNPLDSTSLDLIKTVFRNSTKTLKTIIIEKINSPEVFNKYTRVLPRLPHVTQLTLRRWEDNLRSIEFVDYDFVHLLENVFPNVLSLEIDGFILPHGFVTLGHLQFILKELKVGIMVAGMKFDLASIPPNVCKIDLYLLFISCNRSGEIPILTGGASLKSNSYIKEISVSSNCENLIVESPIRIQAHKI